MPTDPWAAFPVVNAPQASADPWSAFPAVEQTAPTTAPEPSRGGYDRLADIGAGVGKSIGGTVLGLGELLRSLVGAETGTSGTADALMGPVTPDQQPWKTGADIAQFLIPSPAGIAGGAAQAGILTAAQGGTPGETAASAATAGLLPPVLNRAARGIESGAVSLYERALGASGRGMKAAAGRVAPEMIERGVTGSLPTLAARGADESNAIGGQIRAAYDNATQQGVLVSTIPALKGLDNLKSRYVTTSATSGQQVVTNPEAVGRIEKVEEILKALGPKANPNQLWQVRQNLDEIVGGAFDNPAARSTMKEIAKVARVGLQGELDKADPAIKAFNREYGIWKDLEKVAGSTALRRTSQELPLSTLLAGLGGAGSSYASGQDPIQSALTGFALAGATRGIKTPAFRTTAAVGADRAATALAASGSPIARLLAALFGGSDGSPTPTQ